jgi:anaerobic ribonucleoside-triphosphate reductase activating protein
VRISVGELILGTYSEGPGRRAAIWVNGCTIRCPGCINPHLLAPAAQNATVSEIVESLSSADVEGITLLGGEPFNQADACAELAAAAKSMSMGVITFTGYRHEDLEAADDASRRLLRATDLLIDGPYEATQNDDQRALVGSTNQRFIHLTARYASFDPYTYNNRTEIRVSTNGNVTTAGFWRQPHVRQFRQRLERGGLRS